MTIAPENLTCIGRDKQDVQEVKNYGGWIMLKMLGITDYKQEPQLGSRLKQCCCHSNSGGGGSSNSSSGSGGGDSSSSSSSSKEWRRKRKGRRRPVKSVYDEQLYSPLLTNL
jgi:hypothetical protein